MLTVAVEAKAVGKLVQDRRKHPFADRLVEKIVGELYIAIGRIETRGGGSSPGRAH